MKPVQYHFPKKTIRDIPTHGKRVLLRADFNVPLSEDGVISSDYRIAQTIPTIQYLLDRNCEVIIVSHLGRPNGVHDAILSLKPVADRLSELLELPVTFLSEGFGDAGLQALKKHRPKTVTLLENIRFYPGEEANDLVFAQQLVQTIKPDYVVQDGFGVVHRAHASTEGISHLIPAVAGLLLEKEVTMLESAMKAPNRPLVAVLGGAKISDKLPLVEQFLKQADTILIGGAMANTFLKAAGHPVGKSLVDEDGLALAQRILEQAKEGQIVLPVDVAVGDQIDHEAQRRDSALGGVAENEAILDIGFETMRLFTEAIAKAGTVIWNGPMGYSGNPAFAQGSDVIAEVLSKHHDITSIIGGGDTADFVLSWQSSHPGTQFTHISTGGGASLELMSGQKLPGIEALLGK